MVFIECILTGTSHKCFLLTSEIESIVIKKVATYGIYILSKSGREYFYKEVKDEKELHTEIEWLKIEIGATTS